MIFSALSHYYDRLAERPDTDTGQYSVPNFGFTEEKISYVVVISTKGDVVDSYPITEQISKKTKPRQLFVPASFKRSGKYTEKSFESGKDNAFFLWDKTAYALGIDKGGNSEEPAWIEARLPFMSFRRFHKRHLAEAEDKGLQAFIAFLNKWQPALFDRDLRTPEIVGANIVFQLDGDRQYLHERKAAKDLWEKLLSKSEAGEKGSCLVTGEWSNIARLHPAIKGVYGGQSSGGSIVSFNADSFESYGKMQGNNAPVSELTAFKYTTALNYLLNRDNHHCLTVGDASTVFWAVAADSHQSHQTEQLFMQIVQPSDEGEAAQLRPIVEQLSQGQPLAEISPEIDPSTRFYLLGLAPNASRISIRFWHDSSFGELVQCIGEHFQDLALDPLPWSQPPSIYRLLIQLVPHRDGQKPKAEEIPAHLAGELMRSVLTGTPYPHALLTQLMLRIRCDGYIGPLRIAMIKAVLHRDYRKNFTKEKPPMSLDVNFSNDAYQLGRLFAVLERIQSAAIKGANTTIKDRYFGSASTVPYSVFPRLVTGCQHHLAKLRKEKPGYAVNLDKELTGIISKLPHSFPKHLSIQDQGRFAIGYYQQRERFFVSNSETAEGSSEAN
ncbi:MAG: type I-C CRISPR-associated protein Cas8c/Csd1 [Candidatus Thiodiazotropha lotti]|nr:type I-C CRISPR-associated protein Cas8c/Csd1 [Candidatus Thiodiazotropha lotti]MCW4221714.1 type I-C CRISPR-associated protein Cas8c/Csd1 [Candidatus Thiodiazotropha lotti]